MNKKNSDLQSLHYSVGLLAAVKDVEKVLEVADKPVQPNMSKSDIMYNAGVCKGLKLALSVMQNPKRGQGV